MQEMLSQVLKTADTKTSLVAYKARSSQTLSIPGSEGCACCHKYSLCFEYYFYVITVNYNLYVGITRGHSRFLIKGVQNTQGAGSIVGNDDNSPII